MATVAAIPGAIPDEPVTARDTMEQAFPFHLSRCDRVVSGVFQRIASEIG
jgi:hypothetical protein